MKFPMFVRSMASWRLERRTAPRGETVHGRIISGSVLSRCQGLIDDGKRENPWVIIPMVLGMVSTAVFLGWGMLKNMTGCGQLRAHLREPKLRRIYRTCFHACWLKFALILWLVMVQDSIVWWSIWSRLGIVVVAGCLLIGSLWITSLHSRGINSLASMAGDSRSKQIAWVYLTTGITATLFFAGLIIYLPKGKPSPWYLLAGLVFALHLAAYASAYQRLSKVFGGRV